MTNAIKFGLALTAAMLGGTAPLLAQTMQSVAQSGKPTVVSVFFNCTTHFIPSVSGSASHGTVTTDRSTRDGPCGNKAEPVLGVTYTSEPGYKGQEGINLFFPGGQNSSITIQVR